MPPQGESAALALEDAIVLGRVFSVAPPRSLSTINDNGPATDDADYLKARLSAYYRLRRARIDAAYASSTFGWSTQKDSGKWAFWFRGWMTWVFLWWTDRERRRGYEEDLAGGEMDLR